MIPAADAGTDAECTGRTMPLRAPRSRVGPVAAREGRSSWAGDGRLRIAVVDYGAGNLVSIEQAQIGRAHV